MIEKITNQNQIARHKLAEKINELIDIINAIVVDVDGTKCIDGSKTPAKNVQPSKIIYANKRLRKALEIAQTALVKLANDAYDIDEHIYIDGILNQIERITKGGKR